jgi:hypothetical protein
VTYYARLLARCQHNKAAILCNRPALYEIRVEGGNAVTYACDHHQRVMVDELNAMERAR